MAWARGYGLILGSENHPFAAELARQTELQLAIVDENPAAAAAARKALDAQGL